MFVVGAAKMTPLRGAWFEMEVLISLSRIAKPVLFHTFRPISATGKFGKCFFFVGTSRMTPRDGMWFGIEA